MRQRAFAVVLLLLAAEVGDEPVGLSRGFADPSPIGTRCGVMAGRIDRAYLNCAAHDRAAERPGDPALSEGQVPRFPGTITDGPQDRRYRAPGQ